MTTLEQRITETLDSLGYALERADYSHRIADYPPDEQAAYRDNGGFGEGRAAVESVRMGKLTAALLAMIREAQADAWGDGALAAYQSLVHGDTSTNPYRSNDE